MKDVKPEYRSLLEKNIVASKNRITALQAENARITAEHEQLKNEIKVAIVVEEKLKAERDAALDEVKRLRDALELAWRILILYHEQDDYDEHPIDCLMCKLISKCGEALKASDECPD